MKKISLLFCCLISLATYGQTGNPQITIGNSYNRSCWGNNLLPEQSGLKKSNDFGGITLTGRYASYTGADTWYMIYSSDGKAYSCWTDGNVYGEGTGSPCPRSARIVGDDPLNLDISVVGKAVTHSGANGPGGKHSFGRYPCAQLMYNDIWYYGTYLLEQNDRATYMPHVDWPILQPFIGFRLSGDKGETWFDKTEPDSPLLENAHDRWIDDHNVGFNGREVMIGAPHFVDFGENMKYAPVDKKTGRKWAYMVAHGADSGVEIAENSWINGDNIYLIRILMPEGKDIEKNSAYINDAANWQYWSKEGKYRNWNRDNLDEVYENICPIVDATGYLGNVGMVYNAPLGKFIMTLSRCDKADSFNTLILESDKIEGEYKVIEYLKGFSSVSYFMNIPSKFISDDGRKMWLCFSSNYFSQTSILEGSRYAMCLREIELDGKDVASAEKYEAESMLRLGTAAYVADSAASNLSVIDNISHRTDGIEFYSKSIGNRIGIAVAKEGKDKKQMSIYVNGKFVNKIVLTPTGDRSKYTTSYAQVDIKYGDRVTIQVDYDDVLFNRIYDKTEYPNINDTTCRLVGKIDYIVIEK